MNFKKFVTKFALLSSLTSSVLTCLPAYAATPHAEIPMVGDFKWVKEDGSFAKNEWIYTTKTDKNGNKISGWMYFGQDENVKDGWFKEKGQWYYAKKEADPDSHLNDTYFILINSFAPNKAGNLVYYVDGNGALVKNKWELVNGTWYYFGPDGEYLKNTYVDGYKLDMYGRMV